MADVEQEIAALRAAVGDRERERAQAEHQVTVHQGRQEAAMADLASEFGVTTVEEARDKAGKLETALRQAAEKARQHLAQAGGQA